MINYRKIKELGNRNVFLMGADISTYPEIIIHQGKYYEDGIEKPLSEILINAGINCVRVRLWIDPSFNGVNYGGGNNDFKHLLKISKEAKKYQLKLLLDFHYSDFWADPDKQIIPKSWLKFKTAEEIAEVIYNYTYDVLRKLKEEDLTPDYVQIGNEITNGMVSVTAPDYSDLIKYEHNYLSLDDNISGKVDGDNFIKYLKAGIAAVREASKTIKIMIHIDQGCSVENSIKFFDQISELDYDIIGLSYYPFFHGTMKEVKENLNTLALRYNKYVAIAETSYPFTSESHRYLESVASGLTANMDWEISVQGQADFITDLIEVVAQVPNNLGLGVFYWEIAWLPIKGVGWGNEKTLASWSDQAMFDYRGNKLESLDVFKKVYPNKSN